MSFIYGLIKTLGFIIIVAALFAAFSAWVEMPKALSLPLSFIVGVGAMLYAADKWLGM